jgi:hypothetical protein
MTPIGSVSSGPGADLAAFEAVHQLARDISQSERDRNRDARRDELGQGLAAADQMRAQADDMRKGAYVSGGVSIAAGALELGCAAGMQVPTDADGVETAKLQNQRMQAVTEASKASDQGGAAVGQTFSADGMNHAAEGQGDQAVAKAAGHAADEAEDGRKEADRIDQSAKDVLGELQKNKHAAMMAILARQ